MDDLLRLILVTVLAAMMLSFAERLTLDERGLWIAAAPSAAVAV